ncbi:unnamed protein product [Leptosia nina]|uniref:H15 domain-containing protein n=1 Tax=Leptosia nina TaxID=320188 RepID=A0AAV1K376_9NEOP
MADTAVASEAPAPATPAKKTPKAAAAAAAAAKKPKSKPTHPKTSDMVNTAIRELKERSGSSLQAIKKYVATNYSVDAERLAPLIRKYLKRAVAAGTLIQTKGKGASGSFKIDSKSSGGGGGGAAKKPAASAASGKGAAASKTSKKSAGGAPARKTAANAGARTKKAAAAAAAAASAAESSSPSKSGRGAANTADCPRPKAEPATCANCRGPHPANHSTCPVRKTEALNKRAGTAARTGQSRLTTRAATTTQTAPRRVLRRAPRLLSPPRPLPSQQHPAVSAEEEEARVATRKCLLRPRAAGAPPLLLAPLPPPPLQLPPLPQARPPAPLSGAPLRAPSRALPSQLRLPTSTEPSPRSCTFCRPAVTPRRSSSVLRGISATAAPQPETRADNGEPPAPILERARSQGQDRIPATAFIVAGHRHRAAQRNVAPAGTAVYRPRLLHIPPGPCVAGWRGLSWPGGPCPPPPPASPLACVEVEFAGRPTGVFAVYAPPQNPLRTADVRRSLSRAVEGGAGHNNTEAAHRIPPPTRRASPRWNAQSPNTSPHPSRRRRAQSISRRRWCARRRQD